MSTLQGAVLTENAVIFPNGGPNGEAFRIAVGHVRALDWLKAGDTWPDAQLKIHWSADVRLCMRIQRAGGCFFKVLYWSFNKGELVPEGMWPQSFQQWIDDNDSWERLQVELGPVQPYGSVQF